MCSPAPAAMPSEFDILTKPHPWTPADWREYLRVRGREDYRQRYIGEITACLARADAELALLRSELDQVQKTPDLTREIREEVAAEIKKDVRAQRICVDWLAQELNRVSPNWRAWLKPTDPRYDPTERPHRHIGNGTPEGGYPPDVEAFYGPFRAASDDGG
jgi:hypothetical protein